MKNAFSAMLQCVALLTPDVSKERIASIIRVTGIGELEITLAVTNKYYFFAVRFG
jgi:hypothetical protein